jgi:hypothetical protein
VAEVAVITTPSGSAELRNQFLTDYQLAASDAGLVAPVGPGTDAYIIGEGIAQISLIGITNESIHADDANVLTATGAALDRLREGYGLDIVEPTGASGKIRVTVLGSTTIGSGQQLTLPNGKRIQTISTTINPVDGQEIDVAAIDTGTDTNLAAGETVTFVSPPTNVESEAEVSAEFPLTGGTNAEDDERKRDRILNVLRNKPAAGNWAYLRDKVLAEFGFVQDCYIYPALGGPSSQLIVPVREFDPDNNDFSRAPSDALLQAIRNSLQADANTGIETSVRAAIDEAADFAVLLEIPESSLAGGNGQGWTDPDPWPQLEPADNGRVTISAVNSTNDEITVTADTATEPVDGQTQVAWFSRNDRTFYPALVTDHSGTAGAWVLTLDRPLVGKNGIGPTVGDFISPNAQNLVRYAETWVALFQELGPGEMTADANRLPRSKRHPFTTSEDPAGVTNAALTRLSRDNPEITDFEFSHQSLTTPTIPSGVDDPPNVLVPQNLAFYPI